MTYDIEQEAKKIREENQRQEELQREIERQEWEEKPGWLKAGNVLYKIFAIFSIISLGIILLAFC